MIYNLLENRVFKLILFITISLLFTVLSSNNCFFWDSISQISIPANWYYDNNFRYFFVPDEIASGHPTFIGMYIAFLWKLFGKSLLVSHLSMFPFIFGILYQLDVYLKNAESGKLLTFLIFVIVICDATLVSQMSMITFDIPQIFFFLWCINCLTKERNLCLAISFTALMITSLRGSVCGLGILLFGIIIDFQKNHKLSFKVLTPYIPGLLSLISFFIAFYFQKHWIIHNTISNKWEGSSEFSSFPEIIRNTGLVAWRLVDYGRILIWLLLCVIIFYAVKRKTLFDVFFKNTFYIALCQFIVLFPIVVVYRNPFGHRYFLPVIIPISIAVIYWILKYSKFRFLIYTITLIVVFSGYTWTYPMNISMGWDATPAHWPYYSIRKEMIDYLNFIKTPIDSVGSFFPNTALLKYIDISDDYKSFADADLKKDKYILFSNIYNVNDDTIDELFSGQNWIEEKILRKRNVFMILFRRIN